MNFLFIGLWLLFLWSLWKYFHKQAWHPDVFLERFTKKKVVARNKNYHLLERVGRIRFVSSPGWFVLFFSNKLKLKAKLKLIGNPITLRSFLGLKQIIFVLFLIYFWLYIWFGDVSWKNTIYFFVLFSLCFCLPDLYLQAKKERCLNVLSAQAPYFIDLLSLALQTGMNIEQALLHTAQHKKGVVAEAVLKKCQELELGRSIDDLILELKGDLPTPELEQFFSSILRAKQLGVSLSSTLEIQSELIRTRRRQQAEELSRTAAVKISLPLVLFIFPALLIIYIGPGILHLMNQ